MKVSKALSGITLMAATLMSSQSGIADENRAELLKKYYEVADARPFQPERLKAFYTGSFTDHNPYDPEANAIESVIHTFSSLAEGAPDSSHDLQIVEAAGKDLVVVYWKFKGTHTGNLLGMPASDKPFDIAGMEIYKVTDNQISDIWHVEDIAGLMAQLDVNDQ